VPYIDVFVDDDQFDRIIVEEIDFAMAEDREMDTDPELRRAMMVVRNYFNNQSNMIQKSFPFMYTQEEMDNVLSR
jgi:hypothetical protein